MLHILDISDTIREGLAYTQKLLEEENEKVVVTMFQDTVFVFSKIEEVQAPSRRGGSVR
ncbi:hypothetical protein [Salibacterium aidingense]|uniref:hypothetical protein n=1 Tax=Salibacterium aidingense TaxID=384933 RepID=UPI0003F626EA|nr:hypothetical protein [Salibacterium aidingense]